jgi:hypothetical protein
MRSAVVLHAAQHTVAAVQIQCCVDWFFHQHCFVAASSAKLRYPNQSPINDDSANGPIAERLPRVCHDTLPWITSISLGLFPS